MAAEPEDLADSQPFSPSDFLNLPPTPRLDYPALQLQDDDDDLTRACSIPLFAVRRGSVQSSPKLTRLWLAVLSFQAPIGAHPEPVHAQHQEQEQQFTLIGFSAAIMCYVCEDSGQSRLQYMFQHRTSVSQAEWSMASNESLFSIQGASDLYPGSRSHFNFYYYEAMAEAADSKLLSQSAPAPASAGAAGASAHERNWHLDPTNLVPNGSFRWVSNLLSAPPACVFGGLSGRQGLACARQLEQ
ncbi:unnamed protein product [Miscanthus lutarioriparius]|uniref:Uncharacterized protein n=1 Tax=Miscanthus lutarioriparius TaxID=422564 RepID=A0A811Q958_9POAL|nr:unnamed protein product [Miscanthus lutarioriparius]